MPKSQTTRSGPGILAGFDMAKLREHTKAADRLRAPTQEELVQAYGADHEIVGIAREFPASIDEIVAGICNQDQRFLESGRRLLERLLRKQAADTAATSARRSRAGSTGGRVSTGAAGASPSSQVVQSGQNVTSPPTAEGVRSMSAKPSTGYSGGLSIDMRSLPN